MIDANFVSDLPFFWQTANGTNYTTKTIPIQVILKAMQTLMIAIARKTIPLIIIVLKILNSTKKLTNDNFVLLIVSV